MKMPKSFALYSLITAAILVPAVLFFSATTPKVPPLIAEVTMEAAPSTSSPLTVTTTSAAYFVPLGYIRLTCTSPTYYAVEASSSGTALTTDALAPGPVNVNGVTITRSVWVNITSNQWLALLLKGGVQGTCIVEQGSVDGVSGSFTTLAVSSTSAFTGAITNSSTYTGQGAVSAPSHDGGAFAGTTLNLSGAAVVGGAATITGNLVESGAIWAVGGTHAFADAGFNQVTMNSTMTATTTLNKACVALNNASPSIATATVTSGAVCVCSNASTQTNPVKCAVSSTTLTITGPNTTTDNVCYHCW